MGVSITAGSDEHVLVGARYQLGEALGEGGVAIVHRAKDTVSGREVALKQLRPEHRTDRERAIELFRREFHTLSQLAHPNVVSAFDYGIEDGAPYYTMELLDGGDLLNGVPYGWKRACLLARDVCSALSLIHSRRMVYRDLSPKNVRCTSDGRAKLLDFGALAPMGPVKTFVGTPAISAPEAVHLQPLDARTDLYSLGATLYFALTGRRAYAAGRLADLYELWKTPPPPPSTFAGEVPPALDDLVMQLLHLDAALRPASAAETLDRLQGIAGLERDEGTRLVARSYLSTPTLVGRDTSLERFRRRIKIAFAGSGGSVLVHGARGVGRTRFLDACMLEAKIAGALVLRADASDAAFGPYGAARALATQLLEAAPDVARACAARKLDVLRRLVPALDAREEAPSSGRVPAVTPELQRALREWFIAVAAERPLCVAVDDVERIDLPSAGLVALLAREATERKLLIVATIPSDDGTPRSSALALLAQESRSISLAPLSVARTERLLRSLFGDVPNVTLVANRLHTLSGGLPRDLMQLAQQLVDRGVARYGAGAWTLPQTLGAEDLPSDMESARHARLAALGDDARALAQGFALGPAGRFKLGECVTLTEHGDLPRVMSALDELVRADLLALSDDGYWLSGMGWREPLVHSLGPGAARVIYRRLADVCARRPGAGLSQAAYLFDAGDEERGLDVLVEFAVTSTKKTTVSMDAFAEVLQSLPDDWLALFDRGLSLCTRYERPPGDSLALLSRITGISSQFVVDAAPYFAPLIQHLKKEAHYDAPTELSPAVLRLGQIVASATGAVAAALSIELLELLPSLEPLLALAPAFVSWQRLMEGVFARVLGQSDRARAIYERQLVSLAAPGAFGLDETYRLAQELGITQQLGMLEASMGLEKCLERAKAVEGSPLHEVNAIRIRMLYALWQGDVTEADRQKSQAELFTVERARRQTNEGAHLLRELLGHALMDDLTRVKRTLDAIEPLSHRAVGWKTVLHLAHGEYQRIRGNTSAALVHVEAALGSMHRSGHPIWSEAAGSRVRLLVLEGRAEEARDAGHAYLEEATRRGIGYEQNYIRMPLAVALARLGAKAEAVALAELVITTFVGLGATGLNLGLAYETRARVAMHAGERATFELYLKLCSRFYRAGSAGPLAARCERLAREERLVNGIAEHVSVRESGEYRAVAASITRIQTRLDVTTEPRQRAQAALELLLEDSGAAEGFLLAVCNGELVMRARIGDSELLPSMLTLAKKYLADQCRPDELTLITELEYEARSEWTADDHFVYRPVLLSHAAGATLTVTGLALLRANLGGHFLHPAATAEHLSRVVWPEEHASANVTR
ncbi:MAG TPA: serine/threonine-protein kinase [Polyangiaceae bacterium]|jgi:hypothetical protein|nr:serine/threonine-protein kinase [Polyangiaceae bacterium]